MHLSGEIGRLKLVYIGGELDFSWCMYVEDYADCGGVYRWRIRQTMGGVYRWRIQQTGWYIYVVIRQTGAGL